MHALCSQMLTVVLHFLSSTFCMPPKKTSPPHFVQALFFLSPHHLNSFFVRGLTSMSELNAFPSHVFCNSIKLFSLYWQVFFSFSFSSEKKMQWFCSCVPMLSMKISARKLHSFSWRKSIKERFGDLPGHDHSLYWPNNETADTQSLQKQNWTAAYAGKPLPAWAQELVDMVIIAHHIQRARNSALSLIHLCWHRGLLKDTVRSGHNAQ